MYSLLSDFGDKNFCSVATIIADRQGKILNYFINRATNASAESLNAKIKHFRAQLHGVVDVKFFLFRLTNIYAWHRFLQVLPFLMTDLAYNKGHRDPRIVSPLSPSGLIVFFN